MYRFAITPDLGVGDWDSHANSGYSLHRPPPSTAMDSMSPASFASLSSLLTPSESHAFHSFLSTMNPPPPHQDWIDVDVPKDRQALAKATKDLMSLDTQYAHHNDHPFNTLPTSASHYSQVLLPHPPPSDSSSRTPTPTSVPPFSFHQPPSGRQSSRTRASHSHPYPISPLPKQRRSSQSQPQASSSAPPKPQPQKPALLTASQKKANHIQSEQKRRANIRRGYEALCECVPALREAIREEEEALAAANDGNTSRNGVATAKRKGKMAVKGKDGEEKVDGRAGPRSENVVLSKTIDYINELLDERNTLLARLHSARSTLPPGHPALVPAQYPSTYSGPGHEREGGGEESGPLWEREWKGGHGTLGNTCEAGGDESS
ncbi:hypothetical protein D9615_010111 [Tricholomella constricta]|uniref:BHLH domain-containing protein n=1 Tax=Tricholomella constricta TaxID=117010 RepID=A0A8H5GX70_9AGAR|nr:hypothetical protein D9615_010111 [Tricholomella constricta]